jgi:hypothetical protein
MLPTLGFQGNQFGTYIYLAIEKIQIARYKEGLGVDLFCYKIYTHFPQVRFKLKKFWIRYTRSTWEPYNTLQDTAALVR